MGGVSVFDVGHFTISHWHFEMSIADRRSIAKKLFPPMQSPALINNQSEILN